jgi:hypothetical protein
VKFDGAGKTQEKRIDGKSKKKIHLNTLYTDCSSVGSNFQVEINVSR